MAARSTLTVVSGNTITSAWGNSVRDHAVPYSGSNDVTTEGMLCVNTSSDELVIYDGSAAQVLAKYNAFYSTGWSPSCTQGIAVTLAVSRARWKRSGREIKFQANGSFTSSGTAGQEIIFSLPVTAVASGFVIPGGGLIYDGSVPLNYPGLAYINSTTTVGLLPGSTGTALLGASGMTAAVASGDLWSISGVYEAAS